MINGAKCKNCECNHVVEVGDHGPNHDQVGQEFIASEEGCTCGLACAEYEVKQ